MVDSCYSSKALKLVDERANKESREEIFYIFANNKRLALMINSQKSIEKFLNTYGYRKCLHVELYPLHLVLLHDSTNSNYFKLYFYPPL